MPIYFFEEDISFKLERPRKTTTWLKSVIEDQNKHLDTINYIFCSDEYLFTVNQTYLKHNTYTDIITFNNSEDPAVISGDIFISIDRVKDNARQLAVSFDSELHRVLVHGILHLVGYNDKTPRQKVTMRNKENAYLSLRS